MQYTLIFILILSSFIHAHASCELAFNIGPGWYKTKSAIKGDSFIQIPQQDLQEQSVLSIFETKNKAFPALVGALNIKPHKDCFISLVGGFGKLRNGKSFFTDLIKDKHNCYTNVLSAESAPFKATLINANALAGINFQLNKEWSLQPGLGYSYDFGKLTVAGPGQPNYSIFPYTTVGPVFSIGTLYEREKLSLGIAYSLIYGAYRETAFNKADHTTLFMATSAFTNHIDVTIQHKICKHHAVGITFSYDHFKTHKPGAVTSCPADINLRNASLLYDILITTLLVCFINFEF